MKWYNYVVPFFVVFFSLSFSFSKQTENNKTWSVLNCLSCSSFALTGLEQKQPQGPPRLEKKSRWSLLTINLWGFFFVDANLSWFPNNRVFRRLQCGKPFAAEEESGSLNYACHSGFSRELALYLTDSPVHCFSGNLHFHPASNSVLASFSPPLWLQFSFGILGGISVHQSLACPPIQTRIIACSYFFLFLFRFFFFFSSFFESFCVSRALKEIKGIKNARNVLECVMRRGGKHQLASCS